MLQHPAVPSKLSMHSRQKWFSIKKHGGYAATLDKAQQELNTWRILLQEKKHDVSTMLVCFDANKIESVCGCDVFNAKHVSNFEILSPGTFEHRIVSEASCSNAISDLIVIVAQIFAKRTHAKEPNTPHKAQASNAPRKSPDLKQETKRPRGAPSRL